jgi:hypothetical protein
MYGVQSAEVARLLSGLMGRRAASPILPQVRSPQLSPGSTARRSHSLKWLPCKGLQGEEQILRKFRLILRRVQSTRLEGEAARSMYPPPTAMDYSRL